MTRQLVGLDPSDESVARKMREVDQGYDHDHELLMFVLYERPRDFPDGYIFRAWFCGKDEPRVGPGFGFFSLERAELWIAQQYPWLARMERSPEDEAQIMAVWL
jgi:hypothetical protein